MLVNIDKVFPVIGHIDYWQFLAIVNNSIYIRNVLSTFYSHLSVFSSNPNIRNYYIKYLSI